MEEEEAGSQLLLPAWLLTGCNPDSLDLKIKWERETVNFLSPYKLKSILAQLCVIKN